MNIAFEINFQKNKDCTIQEFILNLYSYYSQKHPEINFLLISNKINNIDLCKLPNQKFIKSPSGLFSIIQFNLWRKYFLGSALKKQSITTFISDSVEHLKESSEIKKYLWIYDLKDVNKIHAADENDSFIAINNLILKNIIDKKNIPISRLFEVPIGLINTPEQLSFENKIKVKEKYTDGKEFYLYDINRTETIEDIILIIKAFSHFKKWQKSNMQLVLLMNEKKQNEISILLETYKFREDVKIILNDNYTVNNELLSACYGCILRNRFVTINQKILSAIYLNVPLIIDDNEYNQSSFGEACVYTEMNEIKISQKFILLYKDESYREQIISESVSLTQKLNWENLVDKIWTVLTTRDKI